MKAFLMFVLLFLCSMGTKAQDLGANYNENIDYPITEIEMLKQSKVSWVRGFVNIPNLFLQNEYGRILGVKENAIRTHIPTLKFIQAKKALGRSSDTGCTWKMLSGRAGCDSRTPAQDPQESPDFF